ncbi:hypothetical protein HPB51_011952 [Rhipicephalus microplus]|uniref:DUF7041 domain-containing protein n=1 Tax=Rhipicephalus microplus TaxID=6941 RepID=A0A9J6F2V0_RHIMP|nr:hypothetical protein HPB51_011952 [Rhipicephalus microplus]
MFPQLCPPVPPFQATYPKVWFMQLDAVLAVNGITDQLLMHAILLDALPVELRHLAATSSTSRQPYDALCTAVLARSGNTYRPLPFTRTKQVSPASQSKVRTGPQPSIDRYLGTPALTTSTPDPVAETSTPAPDHDREVEDSPTATDLPSERYIPSEPPCRASSHVPATCTFSKKATARDTVALAVSATISSEVSASSSPQLLVSSSTVPSTAPPPATGASNGLPGASPHSTRTYPASSRPHSASPLPDPVPVSVSWSTTGPSAVPSRSQSLPSSSASTTATTKATATVAPLPVAPQLAPTSRPGVAQVVSASPSPRTSGAPRLIQPKQPQILPKLSSGSANMTTPSAAATTRSQSPRAAQHKATPRPAPVPAPQPATTVQRGAAMGLNTGSPLLIGNPAAAQPGMFPAGPAHDTFLLNQYIPGLGHSPILIQGTLGQTQSSLGQIQGVQLALRPPHATGLTLGPQTGPRPHGEHPGPPGTPTLVIPQNLGPRPNIFLALPRMMSPPSFAIVPGQPLTLQQLQAMLPTQTMLAQPTLGAFQTDQHQSLVQIPTFTQPQILAHAHHHHHHHHHHGALSGPLISTGGSIVFLCTQRQHCHPPSCHDLATHGPLSAFPTRSPARMRFLYSLLSGSAIPLAGVEDWGSGLVPLVLSPLLLLPPRTLSAVLSLALD